MRILHAIAGAPVGGAETFAQDTIIALHERGVGQTVLTRPYPAVMRRYAEAGVEAKPFGFSAIDRMLCRGSPEFPPCMPLTSISASSGLT